MKYLLVMYMNPATWESLPETDRDAVFQGHEAFQKAISESGEMVGTKALAEPADSVTVRVRGASTAEDGLYSRTPEFVCGYYEVDCASKERAIELAAQIPDAQYTAVEVRQVVHEAGPS
jgi:hypothetical protein